ncbi:UDP-4-amino-4,6-dideoxy-N-acetyl-beta-L-altrosamine N-acetyltransferase [Virgibacillus halodenitrificans]|uniref:UDP-4-amino-4, 6-dideoxy-N-acetyl-beta-L-altrosamine N-acetyltransferase n=1 Tax=Virgibacillus halodenitrificans TaxID=1482 RepID=A0ABR7VH78_VIRHA|nr:UDP-4-amino-4,6-dideoxy-N-acetyl-beta-L-altrosamine N-acetyltransferase [Virgibacillus halodenitrificans]MBD1221296.1 UDP-4-amino-4,6-dideoxy-N-acetyl-beta-L-altrosamine N-acetyltransferase [Virgibacillus halodenitrificans]
MSAILRKVVEEDLEMIMKWRISSEVTKYMYSDPELTIEKQRKWYKEIMENQQFEKYWVIQLDSGVPVGLISINNIDYVNQHASWAYYLGNIEAKGKGLARILECNIYDYAFNNLNLNKLWCEVLEFNEKVVQMHEKFGSKIEGKFKEHIYKNGEYHNIIRMAILNEEWDRKKRDTDYIKISIEEY